MSNWTLSMDGARTPELFLESRFVLSHPELSLDGRWLAYASTESGTQEVYVQPYPGPGAKVRISAAGGTEPIWTTNGRELLYRFNGPEAQQYFSVAIRSWSPFEIEAPRMLFEVQDPGYDSTTPIRSWNVSPDGQRFLVDRFAFTDKPVTSMHVVLNWADELKRLVK